MRSPRAARLRPWATRQSVGLQTLCTFVNVAPTAAVYCATKFAVRAITDGLRQEHVDTRAAITPGAIAGAVRFAIEQPTDVDASEIIVRPTAGNPI